MKTLIWLLVLLAAVSLVWGSVQPPTLPEKGSLFLNSLSSNSHADYWELSQFSWDQPNQLQALRQFHGNDELRIIMDYKRGLQVWIMDSWGGQFCWTMELEGSFAPIFNLTNFTYYAGKRVVHRIECNIFVDNSTNSTLAALQQYPYSPIEISSSAGAAQTLIEISLDVMPDSSDIYEIPDGLACSSIFPHHVQAMNRKHLTRKPSPSLRNLQREFLEVHSGSQNMLDQPVVTNDLIESINSLPGVSWTAHSSKRFEGMTYREAIQMMGTLFGPSPVQGHLKRTSMDGFQESFIDLPTSFDARTQWPKCIHPIRDQGACGSCWAHGSSEAASDRLCIETNGTVNEVLSPQFLTSCDFDDFGCSGGSFDKPWQYIMERGLPTDSCVPYQSGVQGITFNCPSACNDSKPIKFYTASEAYFVPSDPQAIQKEIYVNGPVTASYLVFADFVTYKNGTYQYTNGTLLGGHAVKIIGWGVDENDIPFWTVANSWGSSWGNQGFFNIRRGTNECGIESAVVTGSGFKEAGMH